MKNKIRYIIFIIILIIQFNIIPGGSSTDYMDLSGVYAFPVPYLPSQGHTGITFTNLSSEATIKIYTLTGCLVRTLNETDGDHVYNWSPVTNDEGRKVISGVYLYFIYNDKETKIGKLIICR